MQELNFSKEYIESFKDPWEALGTYIVAKAAYDYRNAVYITNNGAYKISLLKQRYEAASPGKEKDRLRKAIKSMESKISLAERDITQIEIFFTTDDHKMYTSVDGKAILRKLKEELAG